MKLLPGILLFIFFVTVTGSLHAQDIPAKYKISPSLAKLTGIASQKNKYVITIKSNTLPKQLRDPGLKTVKLGCYDGICFYEVFTSLAWIEENILESEEVIFVEDGRRIPKEEILISSLDISTNRINVVHNRYPLLDGAGINTSLKENKPDTNDIDLRGRYLSGPLASSTVTDHATIMATMMAGGGNTWHLGKGAAWAAKISSSNFINLLPDDASYFQQYNLSVQNHSYGVGIENYYGADAAAYDASVISNSSLLHVFSSGNSGSLTPTTGTYSGLTGWANQTGSFKMAKNIITVGATDSFGNVVALSSKGPAHDGRIKPELAAYGEDGSSGAAALVSGMSAVLQQQYKTLNGTLPANALIKAVLINSADDAGTAGPDYTSGFGNLNALNAVKTIETQRYRNGTLNNGGNQVYTLAIPAGIRKMKLTLVWNDPAALPNATKALVNDLDLELVNTTTTETWKPWVLNSFPNADSLRKAATRSRDSINNVEQVTIDNPAAGNYNIVVKGSQVTTGSQSFFLAYQLDSTDLFDWQYPTGTDFIFPSAPNLVRWDNSLAMGTATLEYSFNSGNTWQLISNAIDLQKEYYLWNVPSYSGKALLRMTTASRTFLTDTFSIAPRTNLQVGFNCPDSFLLFWNRNTAANSYTLYKMGSQYLEPVRTTTDSFIVLNKTLQPALFYAVAPVFQDKEAVKSYTINYTIQGVECYIRSFFATLNNRTAVLELALGSLFNINKIVLEKLAGNNFVAIQQVTNISSLAIQFTDPNLTKGINTYRIKLELANGSVQYSLPETVYFFDNDQYIVFPNPVTQQQPVRIAVSDVNYALMQVYNAMGAKVFEKVLDDRVNTIPANFLDKGVYFIRIIQNNKREFSGRVVVL